MDGGQGGLHRRGHGEDPLRSEGLTTHREWVAGDRFLVDTTTGQLAGAPYYRMGVLGYSNVDDRYEWNTVDGINATMMTYKGAPGSGTRPVISMEGVFTDQGALGEETIGLSVVQRTEIVVTDADHHVIDIHVTPPGGREFLADHGVYTRISP
ncbi:DUF1579 family protein [Pseudonocardia nematodicida]|uniref:DUF1579 family protein n=1 Tax=Pseudonocardia nematodicida TaxID=1206997 RepID=A0ABV1KGF1_9PSEU